ncbi:MAG TPA: GNAT family N-acetyltransferase [Solirubrobacteraceae bacterium]|nr:GNAT family N-acetyltransferase [Solirubrobacteraceae bacterium]
MAPELAVRPARDEAELRAALALRHDVFCVEQGVSEADEIDGRDGEALHVVAVRDGRVVGTCRVLVDDGIGKLGRMAVAPGARRGGVGARLLDAAEAGARAEGAGRVILAAQVDAERFYSARGYHTVGGHFVDAGIEHVRMEKALR